MTDSYETLTHANCDISIEYDRDAANPRTDWDHLGTMVCWHDKHTLGDTDGLSKLKEDLRASTYYRDWWEDYYNEDMLYFDQPADLRTAMIRCHFVYLPLYVYEHSGITMSASSFSCPWDSGQVGFIYMTRAKAIENWGKKVCTLKVFNSALDCLNAEVDEYDQYLTGQVYGFIVEHKESEEQDSCWGFFGADYCISEAKDIADHLDSKHQELLRQTERDRQHRICELIRNHVPLQARQADMRTWA